MLRRVITHASAHRVRMEQRRILHLSAPAKYGGLERVVHALAVEQRAHGHDARVALFLERGIDAPDLVEELRADDVPVHLIETAARGYFQQWHQMKSILAAERPHVVHTHGYVSDVLARLARHSSRALVATVHGFTGGDRKNRIYEWMQCRVYRSFDSVVAVSGKLAGDLAARGVPEDRIEVIPNARSADLAILDRAAARSALGIAGASFSIGWIGRTSWEKGLDVFIDALGALGDLPFCATVVGDGAQRIVAERRATALGIASALNWVGVVPGAGRLMSAFDVLVNSSRTEGIPITLLEAMAAGVPIVATSVGGVPELLTEQEAILVPAERPDDLARAICSVYADRAAAEVRASRARTRLSENFAVGPWVGAYERIYARAEQTRSRRDR